MSNPARRLAPQPRRNRGVATVEFALIAPILILLVLGIVDDAGAAGPWVHRHLSRARPDRGRLLIVKRGKHVPK
jgi:hypothetical protein